MEGGMSVFRKRLIMTFVGVIFCGFSVGMFQFSTFGMDPFQVFAHGIWNQARFIKGGYGLRLFTACGPEVPPISYGTLYVVLNAVMLFAIVALDKRKVGIGTFINLFFLGYVVDFSANLWNSLFPEPTLVLRIALLLTGIVIMCFSSALYFTGDMGVSTYDAVALIISERKGWQFRFIRIGTDIIVTLLGTLFGTMPGIGTIITAFFMGPLIAFFRQTVAEPFLRGKEAKE